ncbi:MAG: flagellin, partial [Candidatus Puniceispirillaceae bacterium]
AETLSLDLDTADIYSSTFLISSVTQATATATALATAINSLSNAQADVGAFINRLQFNIDNLSAASTVAEAAVGRVMDADYARETGELAKQQILNQAATSMLAQANQSKQSILALLQ